MAAWVLPAVLGVTAMTIFLMAALFWFAQQPSGEPMFKIWSQEIFPTQHRGAAQGIAIAFTRALAAGAALLTPYLLSFSITAFFLTIAAVLGTAGLIGWLWVSRMPQVIHAEKEQVEQRERHGDLPVGERDSR